MKRDEIIKILNKHLGYSTAHYTTHEMTIQAKQFDSIADEIAALEVDKQPDINQPFFGNSGAKPQASKTAEEWFDNHAESTCVNSTPVIDKETFLKYTNQPQAEIREILIKFAPFIAGKYQLFHDKLTEHCEDVYTTDKPFYEISEVVDNFLNLNK
jgi:hypothetical protein